MAKSEIVAVIADEIVKAGSRFGRAWAELKLRNPDRTTWFDNMVIKLDSPTGEGFHTILRKMVRELYASRDEKLRWNISEKVLEFLGDKSRTYWRHIFLTGVYFGYFGYFKSSVGSVETSKAETNL